MDVRIGHDTAAGSLVITPANRWEINPKVGKRIVISRTHPTMDRVASGTVTKVNKWSFHIEWKTQWGRFEEVAEKVQPEDKRCPKGHFRVDMEIKTSVSATSNMPCACSRKLGEWKPTTSRSSLQSRS